MTKTAPPVFDRGEVVSLPRRIGFGRGDALEHFVVLQSIRLAELPTIVVAPLDDAVPVYAAYPGAVPVRTSDGRDMVVLVPNLRAVRPERFVPRSHGRLDAKTLAAVDRVVRILLDMK
jgi:mRNA-degrading endonuclease toxin of MazEF toxin-antitoxin module